MLKDVIKNDGVNMIFIGDYLEFYIPAFYFESKFAENGVIIRSIKIVPTKNNTNLRIFLFVKYPGSTAKENVINSLCSTKGVVKAD